jgi:hypothetical protein
MPRTLNRLAAAALAAVAWLGLSAALPAQTVVNRWHLDYTAPDPGSVLSGAADVINARAGYLKSTQEAAILREQARQARLDTQVKAFDTAKYIRDNTPSWAETLEKRRQEQVLAARNGAPLNAITSGAALNDLLTDIQKMRTGQALCGPTVPLGPSAVDHVNFSTGNEGGVAMFERNRLAWPAPLLEPRFAAERAEVDWLADAAARFAAGGAGDPTAGNQLDRAVTALRARMKDSVDAMPAADYIESLDFMKNLDSSVQGLRLPTAGPLLRGDLTASGCTAEELVDSMTRQGLHFAAAVPGEEPYYSSLYQGLRAYDIGMAGTATH